MIKPFEWHHCLLYGDKQREDYTMEEKGTLDEFLYRMYMLAHDCNGLDMSNSVKALNTAYYLAVALYNTPHVEEENNVDVLVGNKAREILGEEHPKESCWYSTAGVYLVKWMALAILKLQQNKPYGFGLFLDKFQELIGWDADINVYDEDGEIKKSCRFIFQFPKMIEQMGNTRFVSDLRPSAALASDIPFSVWNNQIRWLRFEDIEQLLTHYRTPKDQLAFLDWCRTKEDWYISSELII